MFVRLPHPIADYVDAIARRDVEGMVQTFAADGAVNDRGSRHQGRQAVRAWIENTSAANGTVFTPDTLCHETGKIVVEGVKAGDFEGSPRRFVLAFELDGDVIKTMEIT
jgi:SnoaL-like domain